MCGQSRLAGASARRTGKTHGHSLLSLDAALLLSASWGVTCRICDESRCRTNRFFRTKDRRNANRLGCGVGTCELARASLVPRSSDRRRRWPRPKWTPENEIALCAQGECRALAGTRARRRWKDARNRPFSTSETESIEGSATPVRRHALRAARIPYLEETDMLYWAAVFFVIALIAAFLGFGGIAAGAAGIAKILFFVFLVLAVLSLIFGRRIPT